MSETELVPYGRLLDGPPNKKTNCVGFALNWFGLQPDTFVDTPTLGKLLERGFAVAVDEPAQALAVVFSPGDILNQSIVNHMAVICPGDPSRVYQRDGSSDRGHFYVRELTRKEFEDYYWRGVIVPLRLAQASSV